MQGNSFPVAERRTLASLIHDQVEHVQEGSPFHFLQRQCQNPASGGTGFQHSSCRDSNLQKRLPCLEWIQVEKGGKQQQLLPRLKTPSREKDLNGDEQGQAHPTREGGSSGLAVGIHSSCPGSSGGAVSKGLLTRRRLEPSSARLALCARRRP